MTELSDDGTQWSGVMYGEGRREVSGTRMDNQSPNVCGSRGPHHEQGPCSGLMWMKQMHYDQWAVG